MAIIEQRVRKQGFWVEEVSSWSVQRHKSAEKQEGECRRMCSSEIWTLQTTQRLDGRRLEVVADGLTLWRGAQLAIDTTLVSPLHQDGSPRSRTHTTNGAVLEKARLRKERTYPEFEGEGGWWSWLRRSEVAGQARLRSFCKVWPRLAPSLCRGSFRSVWKPHAFDVGVASWFALQHVFSRRPSWSADQPLAPVARSPR